MWSLEDKISEANIGDLLRVVYTNKEYAVFDISVFNVGSVTRVICTNNWHKYQNIGDNGYSFTIPLYTEEVETIKAYLCKIFVKIEKLDNWEKNQEFGAFLKKEWGISYWHYKKLKALYNKNKNIY